MEFKKSIATTLLVTGLVSGCEGTFAEPERYELNAVARPVEDSLDLNQFDINSCIDIEEFNQIKDLAMHQFESAHRSNQYENISELFSFLINCADQINDDVLSLQELRLYSSIAERPDLVGNIMYETYYSSPESVETAFENIDRFESLESKTYWQNRIKRTLAETLWRDAYTGNDNQVEQLLGFFDDEGPVTQTEMRALVDDALLERTTVDVLNNDVSYEEACRVAAEVKQRGLAEKLYSNEFGSIFKQASYGQNFQGLEKIFFDSMVSCDNIND